MPSLPQRFYRLIRGGILAVGVVLAGGSAAWLAAGKSPSSSASPSPAASTAEVAKVQRIGRDRVMLPEELASKVCLKLTSAVTPTRPVPLPAFQGTIALDNSTLARARSRFPGEVVELGKTVEASLGHLSTEARPAETRPLRDGDYVQKGQLLAVVWSKDLGEKKSELVDALTNLKTHEQTLKNLEDLEKSGGTSDRSLREARQAVQADRNAIARAERTLRVWKMTDAEISAIRTEAERIGAVSRDTTSPGDWARVEIRAPRDGVILQKDLNIGDMVTTDIDLFKIGDLNKLAVWAHVYEEDLSSLMNIPKPIRWTIAMPSQPGQTFSGTLEKISPIIDSNQHTALASGYVENNNGKLRIGQFVTATVELPPPTGEVELPAQAVVEDGRDSVVFVQPNPGEPIYVKYSVQVSRRYRDVVYIKASEKGIHTGDRVVSSGALLLREAMESLPAPTEKN